MITKTVTTKKVKEPDVYFTVTWSRITLADKYQIGNSVPSVPGIYQLYYQDEKKRLNLFSIRLCWYGGLRSTLREHIDPDWEKNADLRKILEAYPIYYRYTELGSFPDLQDAYFFLMDACLKQTVEHSGRYRYIYLKEQTVDPPRAT